MTLSPDPTPDDTAPDVPVADAAAVRRAPRYRAFVLTGVVVAVIPTMAVVLAAGTGDRIGATLVFSVGLAALVGGLIGGGIAVLLDRR